MLNNFSKIIEKLVKSLLINYLEDNNLFSTNQYNIRPERSAEDALYGVT